MNRSLERSIRRVLISLLATLLVAGTVSTLSPPRDAQAAVFPEPVPEYFTAPPGGTLGGNVAVSGRTAAVLGMQGGTWGVHIYERSNGVWTYKCFISASPLSTPAFGYAMSMDGDTLVVADPDRLPSGCVSVYRVSLGSAQFPLDIAYPGLDSDARFGRAVAVQGDIIVVGAPYADAHVPLAGGAPLPNSGAAYSYNLNGTLRFEIDPDVPADPEFWHVAGGQFGQSVAISSAAVAVGHPYTLWAGAVHFYDRISATPYTDVWGSFTPIFAWPTGPLGKTLALDGDTAYTGTTLSGAPPGNLTVTTRGIGMSSVAHFLPVTVIDEGRKVAAAANTWATYGVSGEPNDYIHVVAGGQVALLARSASDTQLGPNMALAPGILVASGQPQPRAYRLMGINSAPVGVSDSVTVDEDDSVTITYASLMANDTDSHGDAMSAGSFTDPAHGTLVTGASSAVYTPDPGYSGPDSFTYVVSDALAASGSVNVAVTVTAVNDAPVAVDDASGCVEDTYATLDVLANDTDIDTDHSLLTASVVDAPANGSVEIAASGETTYTPDTDFTGTDTFTYKAYDGGLYSTPATVTITVSPVNDAPDAVDDAVVCAEDAAVTFDVLSNDTDVDTAHGLLSATLVSAPATGTLEFDASGEATYTPPPDWNGETTFTYTADDGALDSEPATVTITVTPVNDAPVANPDTFYMDEDSTSRVTIGDMLANDEDIDGPDIGTFHFIFDVGWPSKVTWYFDLGSGTFKDFAMVFTARDDWNGPAVYHYDYSDGALWSEITTVTLVVQPVNDAPLFTAGADVMVAEDSGAYSAGWASDISAGAANEASQMLTFDTIVADTSLFSVQPTIAPDGTLTFTPADDAFGSTEVTVTLTDDDTAGGAALTSAEETFTITVTPVNDAPVVNPDTFYMDEDSSLRVTLGEMLANDIDVDGPGWWGMNIHFGADWPAAVTWVTDPSVLVLEDFALIFTAHDDWNGSAPYRYQASDGIDYSSLTTVTLVVQPVNDMPSFTGSADVTVAEDSGAYSAGWATDISAGAANEASQTLTFDAVAADPSLFSEQPAIAADGTLTFTPADDAFGSTEVTVTLTDDDTAGGAALTSAEETFTIEITPVNDAPVAVADAATCAEDGVASLDVLANDTDIDDSSLSAVLVSGPAHGELTLASDGGAVYTPDADWYGTDTFTYRSNDGDLDSSAATVTIAVEPVNDAPVAVADAATCAEDGVASLDVLANDTDIDTAHSLLSAVLVDGPAHGELTLASDGGAVYTPDADWYGTDTFTYKAFDGERYSEPVTVTLTVTSVYDAPPVVPVSDDDDADDDASTTTTDTATTTDDDADDTDDDDAADGADDPGDSGDAADPANGADDEPLLPTWLPWGLVVAVAGTGMWWFLASKRKKRTETE